MTDLMLNEPNDYKIFCSWMIRHLMSHSKLLALLSLMYEKLPLSAFIQFARLFSKWQFFVCLFVCFWHDRPQWAMVFSFTRFLVHTQLRTTVGRTPLDE